MIKDTLLYDLLSIKPDACENDIIVAYYEMAERHHPENLKEKNHDSISKFDEIKFAYDVLSNEQNRKFYDENGYEATKEMFDKQDEFSYDNYTSQNYYGSLINNEYDFYQTPKITKNLVFPLKVSLKDLYRGTKKNFDYQVLVICKDCDGTGFKKVNTDKKCPKCSDQEEDSNVRIREICSECSECLTCAGERVVQEEKKIEINIEKGMRHRQQIAFTGLSNQKPGYETGDLIFILEQSKHDTFSRHEDYLIMKHTINLTEALCGFKILFRHLDGRLKAITCSGGEYFHNQTVKSIPKLGMPKLNSSDYGDLIIKFSVNFPESKSLNLEKIKILEEILPPKRTIEFKEDEKIVEVTSKHVDKNFFDYESDDEIRYAVDENLPEEAFLIKEDMQEEFESNPQRIECNTQ
ncbi:dnaJ -like protein [Brachionus plicatilis]|uniref:DnaJ-like protein n=1 Tax=Brachionus plicatilis TaxID=10195 RepID=A0A3M7QYQ8_BRAPC|nr:dnaJ -like protein [Brachionus plicatilis]